MNSTMSLRLASVVAVVAALMFTGCGHRATDPLSVSADHSAADRPSWQENGNTKTAGQWSFGSMIRGTARTHSRMGDSKLFSSTAGHGSVSGLKKKTIGKAASL
jgi:hypothetical protein